MASATMIINQQSSPHSLMNNSSSVFNQLVLNLDTHHQKNNNNKKPNNNKQKSSSNINLSHTQTSSPLPLNFLNKSNQNLTKIQPNSSNSKSSNNNNYNTNNSNINHDNNASNNSSNVLNSSNLFNLPLRPASSSHHTTTPKSNNRRRNRRERNKNSKSTTQNDHNSTTDRSTSQNMSHNFDPKKNSSKNSKDSTCKSSSNRKTNKSKSLKKSLSQKDAMVDFGESSDSTNYSRQSPTFSTNITSRNNNYNNNNTTNTNIKNDILNDFMNNLRTNNQTPNSLNLQHEMKRRPGSCSPQNTERMSPLHNLQYDTAIHKTSNQKYSSLTDSSSYCQSDNNKDFSDSEYKKSSKHKKDNKHNYNNYQNNKDNYFKRSHIKVAVLHESSHSDQDNYSRTLNAFKSANSLSKNARNYTSGNDKDARNIHGNRNRNSNSFSNNKKSEKPEQENCRFAGYAASPDPSSLPQPPKSWLHTSHEYLQQLKIEQEKSSSENENESTNLFSSKNLLKQTLISTTNTSTSQASRKLNFSYEDPAFSTSTIKTNSSFSSSRKIKCSKTSTKINSTVDQDILHDILKITSNMDTLSSKINKSQKSSQDSGIETFSSGMKSKSTFAKFTAKDILPSSSTYSD